MTVKSEHSHVFPECSNIHTEHVSPTRSKRVSCTMWLALNKAVPLINSYATLQIMVRRVQAACSVKKKKGNSTI